MHIDPACEKTAQSQAKNRKGRFTIAEDLLNLTRCVGSSKACQARSEGQLRWWDPKGSVCTAPTLNQPTLLMRCHVHAWGSLEGVLVAAKALQQERSRLQEGARLHGHSQQHLLRIQVLAGLYLRPGRLL